MWTDTENNQSRPGNTIRKASIVDETLIKYV
jgi:hypothetical protein